MKVKVNIEFINSVEWSTLEVEFEGKPVRPMGSLDFADAQMQEDPTWERSSYTPSQNRIIENYLNDEECRDHVCERLCEAAVEAQEKYADY